MIVIRNRQRLVPIDLVQMKRDVERVLVFLAYESFDIAVIITNNKGIRFYNKKYRCKDKATDILSFPFYPDLKAGERISETVSSEERILGDLIISAPFVQADAERLRISCADRMRTLVVHGICHLLGYNHMTEQQYRQMHAQESMLIALLAGQ